MTEAEQERARVVSLIRETEAEYAREAARLRCGSRRDPRWDDWVQIASQIIFSHQYFPGHEIRPIAIKVDYESLLHIIEFNPTIDPGKLIIVKKATYRLNLSERQRNFIRAHTQRGLK